MVELVCDDCLNYMKSAAEPDLIFADPPYNLGKDFGNLSDKQDWQSYKTWTSKWVNAAIELLSERGTMFITISPHPWLVNLYLDILPQKRLRLMPWVKTTGMLHKFAKNWEWFWELMLCSRKSDTYVYLKPDGIEARDWWALPTPWVEHHNRWFKHPSQKPERLLKKIILTSSNIGDIVFDPFLGSGTTALVCYQTDRHFYGCDINPDFVELSKCRLRKAGWKG